MVTRYKERFQFLIGRVKIPAFVPYHSSGRVFQFLIGRVKIPFQYSCLHLAYMFQFLIGRVKIIKLYLSRAQEEKVSIPHRQSQNTETHVPQSPSTIVSIPHRQSQNIRIRKFRTSQFYQFQFLIGRVKIQMECKNKILINKGFNSSQVESKFEKLPEVLRTINLEFQFLIGRVKIFLSPLKKFSTVDVSIPHRQSQNSMIKTMFDCKVQFQFLIGRVKMIHIKNNIVIILISFNSSQVESKFTCSLLYSEGSFGFNSSQVESKLGTPFYPSPRMGVSIPHRQSQNFYAVFYPTDIEQFQFLIGRVKIAEEWRSSV